MLLPNAVYTELSINSSSTTTKTSDLNSLIAHSQEHCTPVYALSPAQLKQQGTVLEETQVKQEEFRAIFCDLADKIIALSLSYAVTP